MRCSLWTGKERECSFLDPGPWAVTEMGKLGPCNLEHIYREGSIQSLWRPLLGGVPGAGSAGSWEIPDASFTAPGSVIAHWELWVGHCRNIYTTEVKKCYSQGFSFSEIKVFIFFITCQYTTAWYPKISPVSVSLTAASLRLKNGGRRCEGRVEVKHQGKWGTVNDHKWSLEEATVVCRRLGCGAAIDAPQGSYFGPGVGPIWFAFISCRGTESALKQCGYPTMKDYRPQGYSHAHDAGVVCSGKSCLI